MDNIKFQIVDDDTDLYSVENKNQQPQEQNQRSNIKTKITQSPNAWENYRIQHPGPIKLCILTPCYGGQCHVNYVICLMKTIELFKQLGIELKVEFCKNDSLVSRARNNLVARAMTDQSVTHILFIDSDITWNPTDIVKILMADKEVIGGIYPLKTYDWSRMKDPKFIPATLERKRNTELRDRISDEKMIQYNLLRYNVNYIDPILHIENNIARVRHIATGFMLLKRECIEKMMIMHANTKYADDVGFLQGNENDMAYALFDCGVRDGHYFSEDWLFCDRWSKIGGDIWIDVTVNLMHTGQEDYEGSYVASII